MNVQEMAFVFGLVCVTTIVFFAVAAALRPARSRSFGQAIRAFFDWAGMFALFLGVNLAAGVAVILAIRGLTPRFLPLYALESLLLLVLSGAQAFIFQAWWKGD